MLSGDRKSTRLNSSHTEIYTLSLHDALPISLDVVLAHRVLVAVDAGEHQVIDRAEAGERRRDALGLGEVERDPGGPAAQLSRDLAGPSDVTPGHDHRSTFVRVVAGDLLAEPLRSADHDQDRKSTRLNSSHTVI